jgi:hypothetical protein
MGWSGAKLHLSSSRGTKNLTAYNKIYGLTLLVIAFLNCGFTWGFGTKDQCEEARTIVESLSAETSVAERTQAEKSILKLCPDGGAAYYLKGLSLEAGKSEAGQ